MPKDVGEPSRTRRSEVRSRKGCLTCKHRRKKCDEDFRLRPTGNLACNRCSDRNIDCVPPSSSANAAPPLYHHQQQQQTQTQPIGAPALASAQSQQQIYPAASHHHTRPSSRFNQQSNTYPDSFGQTVNTPAFPQMDVMPTELDNIMLDDFVKELMNLAGPTPPTPHFDSSHHQMSSLPSQAPAGRSTSTLVANYRKSAPAESSAPPPEPFARIDDRYHNLLDSSALDALIEKYSPIYEMFWYSTLMISCEEHKAAILSNLMSLVRSTKASRASAVAVCLAYHDLVQRIRSSERVRPKSSLSNGGVDTKLANTVDSYTFTGVASKGFAIHANKVRARKDMPTAHLIEIFSSPSDDEEHTSRSSSSPDAWFQIAYNELKKEMSVLTYDQQFCIAINLRWALICNNGSVSAANFMHELGEMLARSDVTLDKLDGASMTSQVAVFTDVLDAASVRGKTPSVRFSEHSRRVPREWICLLASTPPAPAQGPLSCRISMLGADLVICIQAISELASEARLSPEEISERSNEIEQRILAAKPYLDPVFNSSIRLRSFALQEIWRQTALIHLYQTVHRHGPLSTKLQAALEGIMRMTKLALNTEGTELATWEMCMIWFLASTVAVTPEQRMFCLENLEALGLERANLDNIKVIKELWRLEDEGGHTIDWHDLVKVTGLLTTFIF